MEEYEFGISNNHLLRICAVLFMVDIMTLEFFSFFLLFYHNHGEIGSRLKYT